MSLRKRRLAGKSGCGTSVAALTVLWLLLGLSAFALRVVVPEHAADPLADVAFGAGAAAPSSDGALQTLMLGLMMLALFCATGGMAAWGSYNGHDPARDAQRRAARARRRAAHDRRRAWRTRVLARWSRRRAVRVRERWAPVVVSLQAEAEQLENDIEREQARQASSRTACDAWIEELKEHARLRMAVALTDPAATDAVSARHLRSAPSPASARTPRGAAGVPSSTQESR